MIPRRQPARSSSLFSVDNQSYATGDHLSAGQTNSYTGRNHPGVFDFTTVLNRYLPLRLIALEATNCYNDPTEEAEIKVALYARASSVLPEI